MSETRLTGSTQPGHLNGRLLPGGRGRAYRLSRGSVARITNLHGSQVVDTWAFLAATPSEHLSMAHTRTVLGKLCPAVGDQLYTNKRRALLTLVQDTSPGIHDTLIAACDEARYRMLGHVGFHRNCHDNFREAVADLDIAGDPPPPLNLFMNIPVGAGGTLSFEPSVCRQGDYVRLAALEDLYLVLSACPQDLVPINGHQLVPTDVEVVIELAGRVLSVP